MHVSVRSSLLYATRSSFVDLTSPKVAAPVTSYGPLVANEAFLTGRVLQLERIHNDQLRHSICMMDSTCSIARSDPRQQSKELTSEAWSFLCECLDSFTELADYKKLKLNILLRCLGFAQLAIALAQTTTMRDSQLATSNAYNLAVMRYASDSAAAGSHDVTPFISIESDNSNSPSLRQYAAQFLVVHFAKVKRNLDAAINYRKRALSLIETLSSEMSDFDYRVRKSKLYRAISLVPFLERNMAQMSEEMALAVEEASSAAPADIHEQYVRIDALISALESRMREALALKQAASAEKYINEALAIDPLDSKLHIELGELHFKFGRFEAASESYAAAITNGPPGMPLAYFLKGHCHELLDEPAAAQQCFYQCVRLDPASRSGLEALLRVSKALRDNATARYASTRLQ